METSQPPAVKALARFSACLDDYLRVAFLGAARHTLSEDPTLAALLVLLGDDRIPVHLVAEVRLGDLLGIDGRGPTLGQLLEALELGDDPCLEVADAMGWNEDRPSWAARPPPDALALSLLELVDIVDLDTLGKRWANTILAERSGKR